MVSSPPGVFMAKSSPLQRYRPSLGRTLAALLGCVPVALGLGLCLALWLPIQPSARYLVGSFSVFPAWVGLCLWTLLAADAQRAWLGVVGASVLLGVLIALARGGLALGAPP
jgi:FtsH-binding integral membrane protein